jgi:hypothetical protein
MSALLANVAIAAAIVLSGLSVLLLVVGLVSYFRLRHTRLLWVGIAFLLMAGQGIVLTVLAFKDRGAIAAGETSFTSLAFVNLGIVLALYLAVLKR